MKSKIRNHVYARIVWMGIKNSLEYRLNFCFDLLNLFFPILMQLCVWNAVYVGKAENAVVYGYTYQGAVIYTLSAGFLSRLIATSIHSNVATDIKNGTLSGLLLKPVSYTKYRLLRSFGEKAFEILFVLLFQVGIFAVAVLKFHVMLDIKNIMIVLLLLLPTYILNYLIFFNISMLAFWFTEVGRVFSIIDICVAICSGSIFPLTIFHGFAAGLLRILPFSYTTYFLSSVLTGTLSSGQVVCSFLCQMVWIGLLACLAMLLWKKGLKNYIAVGG